jgi:succinate dehydrogenase / fumarate reductase, cytochrome b subunit
MTEHRPNHAEFLLRRLHSLTGVIPLTGFICFHFYMNSFSTKGPEAFNQTVDRLRGIPLVYAVEWGTILGPFLLHMLLGLWIIFSGKPNPLRQSYERNWAYFLQRVTAIVVFVFVLYHVIGLHFLDPGTNKATGKSEFYEYLAVQFKNPMVYGWYVFAIACTVYHLANGLCTFFITWGLTVGQTSQRYSRYAMAALGLTLFGVGICALNGFGKAPSGEHAAANPVNAAQTTTAAAHK